jgi:hypothetical protein
VAAAVSIPARRREGPSNARCFELLWGVGEVLGRPSGRQVERRQDLSRWRAWRLGGLVEVASADACVKRFRALNR